MAAPPAAVERDTLARCDIFTGLFACPYVRRFLRRRVQVLFASAGVAYSVRESVDPFEFPYCTYDGCVDIKLISGIISKNT